MTYGTRYTVIWATWTFAVTVPLMQILMFALRATDPEISNIIWHNAMRGIALCLRIRKMLSASDDDLWNTVIWATWTFEVTVPLMQILRFAPRATGPEISNIIWHSAMHWIALCLRIRKMLSASDDDLWNSIFGHLGNLNICSYSPANANTEVCS